MIRTLTTYYTDNQITITKLAWHAARIGQVRNGYKTLMENPQRKRQF